MFEQLKERYQRYSTINHPSPLELDSAERHLCPNCQTSFAGHYCPNCGQKVFSGDFKKKETFLQVVFMLIKFDPTFFHTAKHLFLRPGYMIKDFLDGHRVEYSRGPQMLLFLTVTDLLIKELFFDDFSVAPDLYLSNEGDSSMLLENAFTWIQHNKLLMAFLTVTLLSHIFYKVFGLIKKRRVYHYSEYFHAMCYITSLTTMITMLTYPFCYLIQSHPSEVPFLWITDVIATCIAFKQLLGARLYKVFPLYCLSVTIFVCYIVLLCIFLVLADAIIALI